MYKVTPHTPAQQVCEFALRTNYVTSRSVQVYKPNNSGILEAPHHHKPQHYVILMLNQTLQYAGRRFPPRNRYTSRILFNLLIFR